MLKQLYEATLDEARDAKENRNYGPIMGLVVLMFWAVIAMTIANTVDCESTHEAQMKKDGWR